MTFKIGDFVRFVDEDIEGYITSFHKGDLVGVTDEAGFEIPVPVSKVTLVYGQRKREDMEGVEEKSAQQEADTPFITEGVSLAITGDSQSGVLSFFLVNESSFDLYYAVGAKNGTSVKGIQAGQVRPQSTTQVYTANAASAGNWPVLLFQVLFYTERANDGKAPLSVERKIRPADLSAQKVQVPLLGKKAWLFRLDNPVTTANADIDKLKEHFISHRPGR